VSGAGNTIRFNGAGGVSIGNGSFNGGGGQFDPSGTSNAIQGNVISSNGLTYPERLGIDLGGDGVTPNDLGDSDTGTNNLQNFPVLASAISSDGSTTIQGSLNSTPNASFRLEFFANSACHSSGYGPGESFLGATAVITDANGNVSFS